MKIAILTLGTRGDIQPYAVLGQALQERGHEVILSTAKNFEPLVRSYGIGFLPVEADFQAVLDSEDGKKMMKGNPIAIKRNLNTWIYPLISHSLEEFYRLAKESDLVLYHVKTLADSFADQFPGKMVRASVLPIVEPTRAFANPSFSGLGLPRFMFKLSYTLANLSIKLMSAPVNNFRYRMGLPRKFTVPLIKNVYGLSPSFLNVPEDYPADSRFHGFWFGMAKEELPGELIEFLEQGDPPLLITFGSMPFKTSFDIKKAITAASERFNIRIIVIKGWGLDQMEGFGHPEKIRVISSAPYEKLFPRVKAVIHHGGIGTTSECLRAGRPFLICPILYPIGDQQFWGEIGFKKGVALRPVPLKKMSASLFLEKIEELLSNDALYQRARELQSHIEKEKGIENTIRELEAFAGRQ